MVILTATSMVEAGCDSIFGIEDHQLALDSGVGGADSGVDSGRTLDSGTDAGGGDGSSSDSATALDTGDGDAAAPPCDLSKPFGPASIVANVNTSQDTIDFRLSPDELTAYFSSDRNNDAGLAQWNLYVTSRATTSAAFSPPVLMANVNAAANGSFIGQFGPTASGDGLTLLFSSDRNSFEVGSIFSATRASTLNDFSGVALVSALNQAPSDTTSAYLLPSGTVVYFTSDRAGGQGLHDLYRAAVVGSSFGTPTPVAGVNTPSDERYPTVTPDELTIFFSSSATNNGAADILYAGRTSTADPFGTPTPVAELNTANNDRPDWVSADGCRLYFERTLGQGTNSNIYFATRP